MAGDDVNKATTEWQATDKCLTAHAGAPLNLDEAFASLDIPELSAKKGRVRVRQHVNPLKVQHQKPASAPDWTVYADPALPLAIDIGSGNGRFLLALARELPDVNFIGIDIRRPLVERGNKWAAALGASGRVHFCVANATVSLQHMISGPRPYPGPIKLVTILHPDPHYKTKHRKRRVVQPSLVEHLASILPAGGLVVLQSDEQDVARDMRTCFEQHGRSAFRPVGDSDWDVCCHVLSGAKDREKVRRSADSWVPAIPSVCEHSDAPVGANVRERCSDGPCDEDGWHRSCLPVPSDREVICQLNGLPIYRTVLVRF